MKKYLLTALLIFTFLTITFCQEADKYYLKGVEKLDSNNPDEAIKLFTKCIELQPENYYSFYNRALAKKMLRHYEEALLDLDQAVKLAPNYKKGFLTRGSTKKHLTDYEGAISDYNMAIMLDSNYSEAYYNRGLVYEMLSKKDSACLDFKKANALGLSDTQSKVSGCNDTSKSRFETHTILRLSKIADNNKYGYTSEQSIKVGGGPGNQIAYLNLLRDPQGNPIKYKRLGSCCEYASKNGLLGGMALNDAYEITYHNEKGKEKKVTIYISFYDYEEPQVIYGFKTVGQK